MYQFKSRTQWEVGILVGALSTLVGLGILGSRWIEEIPPFRVAACNAHYNHGWQLVVTDTESQVHMLRASDFEPSPDSCAPKCPQATQACLATGTLVSKAMWTFDHRIDGRARPWPHIQDGPITLALGAVFMLAGIAFRWHERRLTATERQNAG